MSIDIEIIDNFLSAEDLKELQSLNLKETKDKEINIHVQKIESDQVSGSGMSKESVKKFHQTYHSVAINILNKLNSKKTNLYEYSEFGITDTGKNYNFPIHNDTPNKLLSGVIYIFPKESVGTKFYKNKKGEGEKTTDWKINRAVFFSRDEKNSYHSFNGDEKGTRRVLIYNLMTRDIKSVSKIEKHNYPLTKFKYLINPYLHRFFKFII